MMKLTRDALAESSVLHESAPRRHPLERATTSLLASSPFLGTNSKSEIEKKKKKNAVQTVISCHDHWLLKCDHRKKFFHVAGIAKIPRFTFLWSIRFVLAQIDCKTQSQS